MPFERHHSSQATSYWSTVLERAGPQIYGELRKLEDAGFIEVDSEGPRRRKAFPVTDAGMAEVRHWLTSVEVDHTLRLEPLLRSVFFWLTSPEQLATPLDNEAAYFYALSTRYQELAEAKDRGGYGQRAQNTVAANRR